MHDPKYPRALHPSQPRTKQKRLVTRRWLIRLFARRLDYLTQQQGSTSVLPIGRKCPPPDPIPP
jgi:hypothetical protein